METAVLQGEKCFNLYGNGQNKDWQIICFMLQYDKIAMMEKVADRKACKREKSRLRASYADIGEDHFRSCGAEKYSMHRRDSALKNNEAKNQGGTVQTKAPLTVWIAMLFGVLF